MPSGALTYNEKQFLHAASTGNVIFLKRLLSEFSVDTNVTDSDGNTAAHLAAMKGCTNVLAALHSAKVNLNARNKAGNTPVQCAMLYLNEETVIQLIDFGVDIDSYNAEGDALIHIAARKGSAYIADNLSRRTGQMEKQNTKKYTALDIAFICEHIAVIGVLSKQGAKLSPYIVINEQPKAVLAQFMNLVNRSASSPFHQPGPNFSPLRPKL